MTDFDLLPFAIQIIVIIAGLLFIVALYLFCFFILFSRQSKKIKDVDDNTLMFDVAYFWQIGSRDYQEDSFYISPLENASKDGLVAAVADGMGGLSHGDIISKSVVDTIESWMPLSFFANDKTANLIRKLSNEIYKEYKHEGGSTLVLANIAGNFLHYYSVGDSNIILIRDGISTVLNQKQNYLNILINSLIKQGKETSEAYLDSKARALTDFIGNYNPQVVYTSKPFRLFDGDTILICSDGVTDSVNCKDIADLVEKKSTTTAFNIKQAIKAKKNPRQDNYTGIVIKVNRNIYD